MRFPAHDRDTVARQLAEAGVQTVVHYPIPIHLQKAYAELGLKAGTFPCARTDSRSTIAGGDVRFGTVSIQSVAMCAVCNISNAQMIEP